MYACICNAVTTQQVKDAACKTVEELQQQMDIANRCKNCCCYINKLLEENADD